MRRCGPPAWNGGDHRASRANSRIRSRSVPQSARVHGLPASSSAVRRRTNSASWSSSQPVLNSEHSATARPAAAVARQSASAGSYFTKATASTNRHVSVVTSRPFAHLATATRATRRSSAVEYPPARSRASVAPCSARSLELGGGTCEAADGDDVWCAGVEDGGGGAQPLASSVARVADTRAGEKTSELD